MTGGKDSYGAVAMCNLWANATVFSPHDGKTSILSCVFFFDKWTQIY